MDKLTKLLAHLGQSSYNYGFEEGAGRLTPGQILDHEATTMDAEELILCEVQKMLDDQPVFIVENVVETVYISAPYPVFVL